MFFIEHSAPAHPFLRVLICWPEAAPRRPMPAAEPLRPPHVDSGLSLCQKTYGQMLLVSIRNPDFRKAGQSSS
jgi:hypothetical protein